MVKKPSHTTFPLTGQSHHNLNHTDSIKGNNTFTQYGHFKGRVHFVDAARNLSCIGSWFVSTDFPFNELKIKDDSANAAQHSFFLYRKLAATLENGYKLLVSLECSNFTLFPVPDLERISSYCIVQYENQCLYVLYKSVVSI